jgi:hypothetical protein
MFSIKSQEIADKNTGVHLAFGDHGKDKSTVWVRITARVDGENKITSVMLHRDGDVISIMPVAEAGGPEETKPAEQKPHFIPPAPVAKPLTPAAEKPKA